MTLSGETTGSLPEADFTGAVLARWTLRRKLGQGAMGPVYEAVSTGGTSGALHLIRPDLAAGEERLARLRRDARTFQKIEHPNVPRLIDEGEARGQVFVVFELIAGRSLQFRLDGKERLSPEEGLDLATDVISALATLHERGILHGDVKPASVLGTPEGYWKLTSFSLASRDEGASPSGVIRGTPLFLAPERCRGGGPSVGSDLYAAGATIFAALSGEPPFLRASVAAILDAHVADEPPDLAARVPGIDPDLLHLVQALMAKTPAQRPPDARTALAVLGHRPRPRTKPQTATFAVPVLSPADLASPDATLAASPPAAGASPAGSAPSPALAPSTGPGSSFDPLTATVADPGDSAGPGTKTTRRMAHEYVLAQERLAGVKDPGEVPWARLVLPALGALAFAAPAIAPETLHAASTARLSLALGAGVFALLGIVLTAAGTVPAGLAHHAHARTLFARLPLWLTVRWNRRRDPVRAADALAELGDVTAGEVLLEAGEPVRAAEEFLRAGIPLAAAIVFEKIGDGARAIDAYMAASKLDDAARVAGELGRHDEAGEAFERAGLLDRAIQAYGRAGSPLRLAVVYERQGELAQAARHYELASELTKAAELFQKAGLVADAARLFHRTGDLGRVAAAWEAAGDVVNAARWRAERELAEGRQANSAREFERAGLHGRAADLFLAQNLLADALRCAEKDGDPARRAILHARTGDLGKAAALHEQAGQHEEAARCFHELDDAAGEARCLARAGEPLEAAEAWIRAGQLGEARSALESVERSSPDRKRALGRLGELEARAGRWREAASALTEATLGEAPSESNVALVVECADALAACGEIDAAVERLRSLEGLPFAPPTLRIRLAELESKRHATPVPALAPPPSEGKELVGRELDRYRTLTYSGEGDLAWAYEAEHVLLKRAADFRILKPGVEGGQAKRFFAEAAALAVARHPNLPDVTDSGKTESGLAYVALELAKDPTLRQLLKQAPGPLPLPRACAIGSGILAGLVAAHRAGVIHGELKPENVVVGLNDRSRIVGFAFARHAPFTPVTTPTLAYVQRRPYASPEQIDGLAATPASDQYACGVILYELLAGEHPLPPTAPGVQPRSLPRPLAEVAPRVPAPLAAAVMKALDRRPAERHAGAQDLLKIVSRFVSQL